MSLNLIILSQVIVVSRKKKRLQKSHNMDFIGPPFSKTNMQSTKIVKIIKI
jgi:hypothetical protein